MTRATLRGGTALAVILAWSLSLVGCRRDQPVAPPKRTLRVLVDESIERPILSLVPEFRSELPSVIVELESAPSGVIAGRLRRGERADVVVLGDRRWTALLEAEGRIRTEQVEAIGFDTLVAVVPVTSDVFLRSADDLADERLQRIGIADPASAPAGSIAQGMLERTGLWDLVADRIVLHGGSEELVEAALRGELDAALLFGSRAVGPLEDRLRIVAAWPLADPVYFAAPVVGSESAATALAFVQRLAGPGFRSLLWHHGHPIE
ncbi:MAG TPA: substrate-binding domain-containing protein [Phycisphaerales bacterium]|nr:substrate-binding domain-containing protein [Phycisphaerales bacterium]HMP36679.1 substrate-binding domain-containing protein [Phycisphaerales bacterium]